MSVLCSSPRLVGWAVVATNARLTAQNQRMITVLTGPGGTEPVNLDTRFYLPKSAGPATGARGAARARLRRHQGQRGRPTPRTLADRGYAVLTWTAQGFGRSGGQIHLDSPDYEVKDAQRLLDWLAARPEVRQGRRRATRGSAWSAARTAARSR